MNYYKTQSGEVYAYDDEQVAQGWVKDGLTPMPEAEIDAHLNPPITLEQAKQSKLFEINAAALSTIDVGFEHQGRIYDSDARSQTNIIGAVNAAQAGIPLPDGFTWRTQANDNVPMDGPGVIALGASLLAHVNAQYAKSWALKAQVETAESLSELKKIVWNQPVATSD